MNLNSRACRYQTKLCQEMVAAIQSTHGVKYNYGANYFPSDPGTGPDWAYGELGIKVILILVSSACVGTASDIVVVAKAAGEGKKEGKRVGRNSTKK